MGFLDFDTDALAEVQQTNTRGGVPAGVYEVIIKSVQERATKSGSENTNFDFVIRNDIQQPRQNAHIFIPFWHSKLEEKETQQKTGLYISELKAGKTTFSLSDSDLKEVKKEFNLASALNNAHLNTDGKALREFNTKEEAMNSLIGKPLRIKVSARDNEYNGEITVQNSLFPNNITKTSAPQVNHTWEAGKEPVVPSGSNPFANSGTDIYISDDDLPF